MKHLAQVSLGQIGGGGGLGPFAGSSDGITGVTKIISSVIGLMTIAAGIWFLFHLLIGGFNWMSAGGDKAKLQAARDKITNALIGLIVVVAAWSLLALASTFFGVDFTISNPGELLNRLSPN
jgi:hypothetical protein